MWTSEGVRALCRMDRDRVLELAKQYAEARSAYVIEAKNDPYGFRAEQYREESENLLVKLEDELSKE